MTTTVVPSLASKPSLAGNVARQEEAHSEFFFDSYSDFTTSNEQITKQMPAQSYVASTIGTSDFCCNQQYSVTAITTAAGAIAERYAYTAYGLPSILNASGVTLQTSNFSIRTSYTGREWDATLGLHHFRARWMSAIAGRFLGRDPIGYEGGDYNLFAYVRSRTLSWTDPTGKIAVSDGYTPPVEVPYKPGPGSPVRKDKGAVWIDFEKSKSRRCLFYRYPFTVAGDSLGIGGVPTESECRVKNPTEDQMIDTIKRCQCCEVVFAGHQSGSAGDNPGGVRHLIECDRQRMPGFFDRLKNALKRCSGCSLMLAACGGSSDEADNCRQELADTTGCTVYGTKWPIGWADPVADFQPVEPCTLDKNKHDTAPKRWPKCTLRPFPFYPYKPKVEP